MESKIDSQSPPHSAQWIMHYFVWEFGIKGGTALSTQRIAWPSKYGQPLEDFTQSNFHPQMNSYFHLIILHNLIPNFHNKFLEFDSVNYSKKSLRILCDLLCHGARRTRAVRKRGLPTFGSINYLPNINCGKCSFSRETATNATGVDQSLIYHQRNNCRRFGAPLASTVLVHKMWKMVARIYALRMKAVSKDYQDISYFWVFQAKRDEITLQ